MTDRSVDRSLLERLGGWMILGLLFGASGWRTSPSRGAETTLVASGSTWRYLDDGSDQGTAWTGPARTFDDSTWASGPAQLGYGDGDEATVVGYGPDPDNKYIATYFRHSFFVPDSSAYAGLVLRIKRDDGAVVYLNGTELRRSNMPPGTITYTTPSASTIGGAAEDAWEESLFWPDALKGFTNVIAVEIHQTSGTSSDISFDLELIGSDVPLIPDITRGPYLQQGTPTDTVVRWRTNLDVDSRVQYGTDPGNLTQEFSDLTATSEHEVELSGLSPDTTYYYSVGTTTDVLAGGDSDHFFLTAPAPGTHKPTRVWVLGDSGTADGSARAVRDAYYAFTDTRYTDLWLMLGDNAYNDGTDLEHQAAVFDMYPTMLRKSVLWPTLGNHDGHTADSATQTGPYYDIFTLPTAAEAGGLASGTEAYYSFDYSNIHFICLDSYETDRSVGGAMMTWLEADLAATDREWVIAFWHHPPYSKGSHDSDTETQLIEMRENALPILEAGGVDLVLAGHSHSYERSYLLDGHYGLSGTLTADMKLDDGNGRPSGDGAYRKPTFGLGANEGAVYAVAGSSGKTSGGSLNHPVMYISMNVLGSMVLDFNGDRLDAKFLDSAGTIQDDFTIIKGTLPVPALSRSGLAVLTLLCLLAAGTLIVRRWQHVTM